MGPGVIASSIGRVVATRVPPRSSSARELYRRPERKRLSLPADGRRERDPSRVATISATLASSVESYSESSAAVPAPRSRESPLHRSAQRNDGRPSGYRRSEVPPVGRDARGRRDPRTRARSAPRQYSPRRPDKRAPHCPRATEEKSLPPAKPVVFRRLSRTARRTLPRGPTRWRGRPASARRETVAPPFPCGKSPRRVSRRHSPKTRCRCLVLHRSPSRTRFGRRRPNRSGTGSRRVRIAVAANRRGSSDRERTDRKCCHNDRIGKGFCRPRETTPHSHCSRDRWSCAVLHLVDPRAKYPL